MKNLLGKSRILLGLIVTGTLAFSGCGGTRDSFVVTDTNLQLAPVATNDSISAFGNATVNRSAADGVLANDQTNGAGISSFDQTSAQGGTVVLNSDGSYSYTPAFGFKGVDTFTYTLANFTGSSTGTVTIRIDKAAWFVDNSGAAGNGSQATPFKTLADALAKAASGDTVFVARGDGTSNGLSGAVNLPAGVNLVGEGTGLVLAQTIVPPGTAPVLTGPINCGGNNTISGLDIEGSSGVGIFLDSVGDVTVSNNTVKGAGGTDLILQDPTGTLTIENNHFYSPGSVSSQYITGYSSKDCNITITGNVFEVDNAFSRLCYAASFQGTGICNFVFSGNSTVNPNVDGMYGMINSSINDSAQVNLKIENNTCSNLDSAAFYLTGGSLTTKVSGDISGNTISSVTSEGMYLAVGGGLLTVSNNKVSGVTYYGINLDADRDTPAGSYLVTGNTVSDGPTAGIHFICSTDTGNDSVVAIRDNTVSNTTGSIKVERTYKGNLCAAVTGNTVADDIQLVENGSGGSMSVEQVSILETLNTFTAGVVDITGIVVEANEGACGI